MSQVVPLVDLFLEDGFTIFFVFLLVFLAVAAPEAGRVLLTDASKV